ncbi:MAG: hypothetical protein MZV70_54235, partial [Desulfobacterales bacterium]|nr:hypothetical protein [Desulfobacterales bacterium]
VYFVQLRIAKVKQTTTNGIDSTSDDATPPTLRYSDGTPPFGTTAGTALSGDTGATGPPVPPGATGRLVLPGVKFRFSWRGPFGAHSNFNVRSLSEENSHPRSFDLGHGHQSMGHEPGGPHAIQP